jgi:type I restriction enzyme M protein
MILLAELNLASTAQVSFSGHVADALTATLPPKSKPTVIFTNPPFGVYVDRRSVEDQKFTTAAHGNGKLQSEVLFVEQCLRWLQPGGRLGIVLPRSIVSNATLDGARRAIDKLGRLEAVINLPPETFAATGAQTNAVVLFLRKRSPKDVSNETVNVAIVDVENVGYDSTGRSRDGSQLAQAGDDLRESLKSGRAVGLARHTTVPADTSLESLGGVRKRSRKKGHCCLGDLVLEDFAKTGRTPPRKSYVTEGGIFAVKVGNLSGAGINWAPRDRNFVRAESVSEILLLEEGDIVLTSSAHNPKYIAKKVDLVFEIPEYVGGRATFVGEVPRLRGSCLHLRKMRA